VAAQVSRSGMETQTMMDVQKGDFVVECDGCGEVLETGTSNFEAARSVMRREGWKPTKIGDVWTHACPGCWRRGKA
jgi:hypothetical protein